ncbi:MAG: Yip1 family protein, partial [Burkholderiaceae bacterium]
IPAIASFIGMSLIGIGAFGFSYRMPLLQGLIMAVGRYVISLIMIFVLALIVDALAPTFNGTKNSNNALKLVAYGSTAGFVAGVFTLIPMLGMIGILVSLYSIYLVYSGLPTMMKCPQEKAAGYTAVVVVCAIVAGLIIGAIVNMGFGAAGYGVPGMFNGGNGAMNNTRDVNANMARMQIAAEKMKELSAQMQQAQVNAGAAATPPAPAMPTDTGSVFSPEDLKAVLPDSIGDFKRTSIESHGSTSGLLFATASAKYNAGNKEIQLGLLDQGSIIAATAMQVLLNTTSDQETNVSVDKMYRDGKRSVHEKYLKDGSTASYTIYLENGVHFSAEGKGVDIAALKNIVSSLNVDKLEAMKRPAKQ